MKKNLRKLTILMNGFIVGELQKTGNSGLVFSYDQQWLSTPGARSISLSLPLIDQRYEGDLVYNFFDNLLPDNFQIRARIQAKFKVATDQPFDLLASVGKDCVGAIQLIEGDLVPFKKEITFENLTEKKIAAILRDTQFSPLGMSNANADFRISIAGAQEKTAFLLHKGKWCRPLGATPTTHIFKLPIGFIRHQHIDLSDSCENEWLCSKIAEAFGLLSAKSEILIFEDQKVLVVERFDRRLANDGKWLIRLPQEDMCQALGISPNLKYQNEGGPGIKEVMKLLLGSANATADRDLFYKSQVLFWLLAAIDGHAKNFSIHIGSDSKYALTPLYDIISAYPLIQNKQLQARKIKMAMALTGNKNHYGWFNMLRRNFLQTAKDANYSVEKAEHILEEMLGSVEDVINKVSGSLPRDFPTRISTPIFEGLFSAKNKLKN